MQSIAVGLLLLLLAVETKNATTAFPLSDLPVSDDQVRETASSTLQDVADDPSLLPVQDEAALVGNETVTDLENNGTVNGNESDSTNGAFDDIFKSVRDHDRERRLEAIRMAVLNSTGRTESPYGATDSASHNNPYRDMMEILKQMMPWNTEHGYTEKVQSFYPVCMIAHKSQQDATPSDIIPPQLPNIPQADERDPMHMFLYFNLSYPTPLDGSVLSIVAARLKLYKFSQNNQSNSNTVAPCATRRTLDSASALEAVAVAGVAAVAASAPLAPLPLPAAVVPTEPYVEDDRRIRVSVYYYARSHKKNRLRRKLLDTKMLPMTGNEWVDLNVRAAARTWRNASKNFGLMIEVEDEEGKALPASRFFSDMNCSKEASTSRPIPSFLIDAARERHQNTSAQYNADLYPVIDLCTMDIPKSDKKPPVVPEVSDQAPIQSYPTVDLHNQHGTSFEESKATSVVLVPFHKLTELQNAKHRHHHHHHNNQHHQKIVTSTVPTQVDDEEILDGNKNSTEPLPVVVNHHETINPEEKQVLDDNPTVMDLEYEPSDAPHPHRHYRNQHRIHSHEEFGSASSNNNNKFAPDWRRHEESSVEEEVTDDDQESSSSSLGRRTHHQQHNQQPFPYRLHHKYHHHSHQFHTGSSHSEDDWSGEVSRRLVVVPATELLALSEQIEREQHNKHRMRGHHEDRER